jgi:hypothetical protein
VKSRRACIRAAAFLFRRDADTWLTLLRIGLSLHVVLYCIALRRDWHLLFASAGSGMISRQFSEALVATQSPFIPVLGWFVNGFRLLGVNEQAVLSGTWLLLLVGACLLGAGLFCRASAVAVWLLHLGAAKSGALVAYGVDNFMTTAPVSYTHLTLPTKA